MRVQPRKQILDIWESLLRTSYDPARTRRWEWGSGSEPDSVGDAEQLLVLLHPTNKIDTFELHSPDRIKTDSDLDLVLRPAFPGPSRIPPAIVDICSEYFERHTRADGQPSFTGGQHLFAADTGSPAPTAKQRETIEVVDSYSISVTLCLAVLSFVTQRAGERGLRAEQADRLHKLNAAASKRLTAAMVGLIRCFAVNAVFHDDAAGQVMLDTLARARPDLAMPALVDRFHDRLERIRARLRANVSLGIPETAKPDDDQLFEIGWTWGVPEQAPAVDVQGFSIASSAGFADPRPYLYFTVVALDGIAGLFSARVRDLDMFDEVQTRLVDALRVRWELTQRYWSAMARFDPDSWPLQDLPWRASDGESSDYYSLLVTSVLIKDFEDRAPTASDLARAVDILSDLAGRSKITRRMTPADPAMGLHWPGARLRLLGSDGDGLGPLLAWHAFDFTPMLLKRSCQAMRLTNDVTARTNLMRLAEAAMDHLEKRRITQGRARGLWDDVTGLLPPPSRGTVLKDPTPEAPVPAPSWYFTERVVEALVAAAEAYGEDPPRSEDVYQHLQSLLSEAEHLYNQHLMDTDTGDRSRRRADLDEVELKIRQAHALEWRQTGTAVALANQALVILDGLGQARTDARRDG